MERYIVVDGKVANALCVSVCRFHLLSMAHHLQIRVCRFLHRRHPARYVSRVPPSNDKGIRSICYG